MEDGKLNKKQGERKRLSKRAETSKGLRRKVGESFCISPIASKEPTLTKPISPAPEFPTCYSEMKELESFKEAYKQWISSNNITVCSVASDSPKPESLSKPQNELQNKIIDTILEYNITQGTAHQLSLDIKSLFNDVFKKKREKQQWRSAGTAVQRNDVPQLLKTVDIEVNAIGHDFEPKTQTDNYDSESDSDIAATPEQLEHELLLSKLEAGDITIDRETSLERIEASFDAHTEALNAVVQFFARNNDYGGSVSLTDFLRGCSHCLLGCRRRLASYGNISREFSILFKDIQGSLQREESFRLQLAHLENQNNDYRTENNRLTRELVRTAVCHLRLSLGLEFKDDGAPIGTPQLVVVMVEIAEFRRLIMDLGMREMYAIVEIYKKCLQTILTFTSGYEVHDSKESYVAAFSDTKNGIDFALGLQRELLIADWPQTLMTHPLGMSDHDGAMSGLRVKIAITTGPAKRSRNKQTLRAEYFGDTVDTIPYFMVVAQPGQVVMSKETCMALRESNAVAPNHRGGWHGITSWPGDISDRYDIKRVATLKMERSGKKEEFEVLSALPVGMKGRDAHWTNEVNTTGLLQKELDTAHIKKIKFGDEETTSKKGNSRRETKLEREEFSQQILTPREMYKNNFTEAESIESTVKQQGLRLDEALEAADRARKLLDDDSDMLPFGICRQDHLDSANNKLQALQSSFDDQKASMEAMRLEIVSKTTEITNKQSEIAKLKSNNSEHINVIIKLRASLIEKQIQCTSNKDSEIKKNPNTEGKQQSNQVVKTMEVEHIKEVLPVIKSDTLIYLHQRVRKFYTLMQSYLFDQQFPFIDSWVEPSQKEIEEEQSELESILCKYSTPPSPEGDAEILAFKQRIRERRLQNFIDSTRKSSIENEEAELNALINSPLLYIESISALLSKLWVFIRGCLLSGVVAPPTDSSEINTPEDPPSQKIPKKRQSGPPSKLKIVPFAGMIQRQLQTAPKREKRKSEIAAQSRRGSFLVAIVDEGEAAETAAAPSRRCSSLRPMPDPDSEALTVRPSVVEAPEIDDITADEIETTDLGTPAVPDRRISNIKSTQRDLLRESFSNSVDGGIVATLNAQERKDKISDLVFRNRKQQYLSQPQPKAPPLLRLVSDYEASLQVSNTMPRASSRQDLLRVFRKGLTHHQSPITNDVIAQEDPDRSQNKLLRGSKITRATETIVSCLQNGDSAAASALISQLQNNNIAESTNMLTELESNIMQSYSGATVSGTAYIPGIPPLITNTPHKRVGSASCRTPLPVPNFQEDSLVSLNYFPTRSSAIGSASRARDLPVEVVSKTFSSSVSRIPVIAAPPAFSLLPRDDINMNSLMDKNETMSNILATQTISPWSAHPVVE